jgi:hypothetical protein
MFPSLGSNMREMGSSVGSNGDGVINQDDGDGVINQDDDVEEVLTVRVPTDNPWDPTPWVDHFVDRYRGKIVGNPLRIELEYWFDQMLWAYDVYFQSRISGSHGEDGPDRGTAVCETCSALVSSQEAHEAWHLSVLEHQ